MRFDEKTLRSTVAKLFDKNSLSHLLSREASDRFIALTEIMLEENEKYNLTAITDPGKIAFMHYLDSATVSAYLKHGESVLDVGCGAGFPTLPLAILRPDLKITALDATAKRVAYVENTARALGLSNVTAICERAEVLSGTAMRESFDTVTARAVAAMPILSELCLPFVRVGGRFLAMKGKNARFELNDAKRAIPTLGGKLSKLEEITLIGSDEEMTHPIIIIDKVAKTPRNYPRPFAQISKKPL